MKKPQRNFVIEYKSGRRKTDVKAPNSIWGNMDLKSVARDVESVLPPQLSGDVNIMASKPTKPPESPALAKHVLDRHPSISSDVDVVNSSWDMGPATGDVGAAQDENDAQGIADTAKPEPQARRPRKASKRRALGSQPLPKAGSHAPIELDVEQDELDQLEEENRVLRKMLVAKLRMENSWLRERQQAGR